MDTFVIASSFRDPSGFLFTKEGVLLRQVNKFYQENYDFLINSGLYSHLVENNLLIPHEEVAINLAFSKAAYKVLKPELIPFISYPYEWSYTQLKDAALTTLEIQKIAFKFGMTLKDSSAYNIQFFNGKPMFIDTLSFEKYVDGEPWIAYKQFCQHFLAPLALMSLKDIRLNQLLKNYIDGIPLDLTSKLLPLKAKMSFSIFTHIYLHGKSQKHFADKQNSKSKRKITKNSFLGIIDSLETAIKKLNWKPIETEWGDYYNNTNYSINARNSKAKYLSEYLDKISPKNVWDLGSNDGFFSRIASNKGIFTLSLDIDPVAVEKNYILCKNEKEKNILPLIFDLTNPSPAIGWENNERLSLYERGAVDTVFALALIHHLAISNNLPFSKIAKFFSNICKWLIIEFVPKSDSQVQKLLRTRKDIFFNYTQIKFENEFKKFFKIISSVQIEESERTLYLMRSQK